MSDTRLLAAVSSVPRLTSDGNNIRHRGLRDGSAIMADLFDALGMEGRIFVANMGTVTTPITFLVTAANRPDAWIRVPANTAILPILVNVSLEAAAGTDTEIDVRAANNDIGNGTSSAADIGPLSTRNDGPVTSACTARQLATGDTTAETTPRSLYRYEFSVAEGTSSDFHVDVPRSLMGYPCLVGPATWEVFIAATSTQAIGYVVMTWAEIPSSMIV